MLTWGYEYQPPPRTWLPFPLPPPRSNDDHDNMIKETSHLWPFIWCGGKRGGGGSGREELLPVWFCGYVSRLDEWPIIFNRIKTTHCKKKSKKKKKKKHPTNRRPENRARAMDGCGCRNQPLAGWCVTCSVNGTCRFTIDSIINLEDVKKK